MSDNCVLLSVVENYPTYARFYNLLFVTQIKIHKINIFCMKINILVFFYFPQRAL